ncbi:hypothetical protein [Paenibacillus oryzisoli]|uniref:hypothetical protein n=1 Tax=Paenibacillus oryzisoli TaxID=1850517 RepID=UPI001959D88D|nr:hypothetical protein [Paenibacillus oryzisoli]
MRRKKREKEGESSKQASEKVHSAYGQLLLSMEQPSLTNINRRYSIAVPHTNEFVSQ